MLRCPDEPRKEVYVRYALAYHAVARRTKPAAPAGAKVGAGESGGVGEVARQQRDHARGEERDEPGDGRPEAVREDARKHTSASYADIGRHFGGRNHSTVVAAEKKARQWLEANEELTLGERRVRVRELVDKHRREPTYRPIVVVQDATLTNIKGHQAAKADLAGPSSVTAIPAPSPRTT